MSFFSDFIFPFNNLEQFLKALYVIENYQHISTNTITNVINIITNFQLSPISIENLKSRYFSFPELYGRSFFTGLEKDLKSKIDSLININEQIVHFMPKVSICEFCLSNLSKNNQKSYNATCFFFSTALKRQELTPKYVKFVVLYIF